MSDEEPTEEVEENVFKLTILVPLIRMLNVYTSSDRSLSPDEFCQAVYARRNDEKQQLQAKLCLKTCRVKPPREIPDGIQVPPVALRNVIADLFFSIIRLEPFLTSIGEEYYKYRNRHDLSDMWQTLACTVNDAVDCLIFFNTAKILALLSYLLTPELPNGFYVIGSTIFDCDFVQVKILDPFIKAVPVLQRINMLLVESRHKITNRKALTVPIEMQVLRRPKRLPAAPACTPEDPTRRDSAKPVPKTTYRAPDVEAKLAILRAKHRTEAAQLLEDANVNAPSCSQRVKSPRYSRIHKEIEDERMNRLRIKTTPMKPPIFKHVPIKKNATTILREGARIASDEIKEVQKLKDLMQGACDPLEILKLEYEVRQQVREEALRKIEEGHLAGLLSREETLIAKQDLMEEMRAHGNRVRQEREELNAKLDKWRQEQCEKIRETIEKCHNMEQAARDAHFFMVDEKRQKAAEVLEESRQIRIRLCKRKEEELRKKVQLIHEIRTLQALHGLRVKEFDKTETSGLGLLCEMSLAELKERLFLVKTKLTEELQERREAIRGKRQRQQNLIKYTQKSIDAYKANRQFVAAWAPVARNPEEVLKTPEIEALRRRLQERRMTRREKMNQTLLPSAAGTSEITTKPELGSSDVS